MTNTPADAIEAVAKAVAIVAFDKVLDKRDFEGPHDPKTAIGFTITST